jgi:hypothetical protein
MLGTLQPETAEYQFANVQNGWAAAAGSLDSAAAHIQSGAEG